MLSIAYWGNIEYFAELFSLAENGEVNVLLDETFPKQSFRNSCEILGANGVLRLTIPVEGRSKNRKTKAILITEENWQRQHIHSIKSAYARSPYYEYYADEVLGFYNDYETEQNLSHFCLKNIELCLTLLQKPIKLNSNCEFEKGDQTDLRNRFKSGKKHLDFTEYYQTFSDRFAFEPNLSILDLLFNLGPESLNYILTQKINLKS